MCLCGIKVVDTNNGRLKMRAKGTAQDHGKKMRDNKYTSAYI